MFGFSLAELIMVFLVAIIFIKPSDLPELARFAGKMIYRAKTFFEQMKSSLKEISKEIGVDDIKQEFDRGVLSEKIKIEDEVTVIVDMEGNEHIVPNIHEVRSDLDKEEIKQEIERLNKENKENSLLTKK